jgi:hypothetical protein
VCASGRGGAERRRLDLIRLNSAANRHTGVQTGCVIGQRPGGHSAFDANYRRCGQAQSFALALQPNRVVWDSYDGAVAALWCCRARGGHALAMVLSSALATQVELMHQDDD